MKTITRSVATTILEQLGGNKFIEMTGCNNFHADKNMLCMKIPRNKSKANGLSITLLPDDTYLMIFSRFTPAKVNPDTLEYKQSKFEVVKEYKNVYCDMLQDLFTDVTGMQTKLF